MRHSFLSQLLFLGVLAVPCLAQTAQPPGIEGIDDPNKAKKLIHYWADYACFSLSDGSEPKLEEQCKAACDLDAAPVSDTVVSSMTCWLNGPESDFRLGLPLTEEQKKENPRKIKTITTGYCTCNDPIINFAGDFFIKSIQETGKVLEKFACPLLMAVDLVVEVGSAAIPGVGKAITTGMKVGIKTAKMFKYAYNAQDAAMEFASMVADPGFGLASGAGCSTPFSFSKTDLAVRFLDFADAPDQLVPGINYDEMPCPKGKKASKKCKEKNGEKDEDDSPSKTGDNNQPTQTKDQPSKTSDQPSQTSDQASSTTSDAGPTAKADCAAIGRKDMEAPVDEFPEEGEDAIEKRVGGATLQSRRLTLEARKLAPKKGSACEEGIESTTLNSRNYPSAGDTLMKNADAYGFNIIHDCGDYGWGPQKYVKSEYDTEHILEWSTVTNFFTVMNEHEDFKDGFNNPDPENLEPKDSTEQEGEKVRKKVKFCTYWAESWDWSDKDGTNQKMPDPVPPVPAAGQYEQKPFEWFAEAFPFIDAKSAGSRKAHEKEFVLLQKKINSVPKNRMFSKDPKEVIYNDKDMDEMIKRANASKEKGELRLGPPLEQPRKAVQRMRAVIGAFLYMKEDKINKIFIDQVDRIGAQLEHLENALAENPRKVKRTTKKEDGKVEDRIVTFDKWEPQNLKEKWFKYMDDVTDIAIKKGQDFMKTNIARLKEEYNDKKMIDQKEIDKEKNKKKQDEKKEEKKLREDMKKYIDNLEKAWAKAKNWERPKWNAKK